MTSSCAASWRGRSRWTTASSRRHDADFRGDRLESPTGGTPNSLGEALEELAADTALVSAVGELLVANHIGIKEMELERTAALAGDALRDYYIFYV